MDEDKQPDFSAIIDDNEQAAAKALDEKNFVQAFLLVHALIEALLRLFLRVSKEDVKFSELIRMYQGYLEKQCYPRPEFVDELTKFYQRRNRIVHELWEKGHSLTNSQAEPAANAAVMMYGLFIEWLETFDPGITKIGFQYEKGV